MVLSVCSRDAGAREPGMLSLHIDNLIPITDPMGFDVSACAAEGVCIRVPASANRNDKGTVFAGSIFSALVLAPWYLLHLTSLEAGVGCDIAVYRSEVDFRAPARGDFSVRCVAAPAAAAAVREAGTEGVAKVALTSEALADDGTVLAAFNGRYHLRRRQG